MRYHLKNDGTAGVCRARPGHCPKGNAIHGDSVEDVYHQLGEVMRAELLPKPVEKPARPSPVELGRQGQMMHYTDPLIVKAQLEAIQKLGLTDEAYEVMETTQPVLAGALRANKLDAIDYGALYVKPSRYNYGDEDQFISDDYTWVADAHYQLQTVALYSYMDRLETGSLVGADREAYRVALGDTGVPLSERGRPQENSFLAFNYNPHRQPKGFFDRVKARMLDEGFREDRVDTNRTHVTVPSFIWDGLDHEAKTRVATQLFHAKQSSVYYGGGPRHNAPENLLHDNGRGNMDFGGFLKATLASHRDLDGQALREGQIVVRDHGEHDASKPVVKSRYRLTDTGVEFEDVQRLFYSAADRKAGEVKRLHAANDRADRAARGLDF